MTETLFYHLERRSLDEILPGLVEKSLSRGWRAAIRTDSSERSDALDTLLWTYDETSFLPHAQLGDGDPGAQPVLITVEEGNPNSANIVFYVGGAMPGDWTVLNDLARIVLLFDGRDEGALAAARAAWKTPRPGGMT
jgi:DNA polymerase-3 subunit chi